MIFLPWIVFFLGMTFIFWRGFAAKREHLRRRKAGEEADRVRAALREDTLVAGLRSQGLHVIADQAGEDGQVGVIRRA